METKKIAFLSWESMHSLRFGGQAPAVTGLAEALARMGHEVHFFTANAGSQRGDEEIAGINYHRCSFDTGGNILWHCHNMSMAMLHRLRSEERHGRFDLVHGHDWHVVDALHELKGSRPLLLTFHSTEFGRNGGEYGDWWEYREISGKEWYGGYIADRITTVSHTMKGELSMLYRIPHWKVDVVPNGIEQKRYEANADPGRIKERYGIHPLAPVILFVGRLVRQKGPDLLVEAVPRVLAHRWDAKFIFVGGGGMEWQLKGRANQLGVSGSMRFAGYVSEEEKIALLKSCDMVAMPSRNEPFGIVLLEAWSASKAPVAADIGALAENIDNFKDGIKVYHHPESIAWGINRIIDDPAYVAELGKRGRIKVRKKFAWPIIGKGMEEAYSRLEAGRVVR